MKMNNHITQACDMNGVITTCYVRISKLTEFLKPIKHDLLEASKYRSFNET
jgi:hypothetical protein